MTLITEDQVDDQGLDLEVEEEQQPEAAAAETPDGEAGGQSAPPSDLGPEIEEEIKRVMVEDEPSPKAKGQLLPDRLIHEELRPEDFFDEGSI